MESINYNDNNPPKGDLKTFIEWYSDSETTHRGIAYYRGQADTKWLLTPKIFREPDYSFDKEVSSYEGIIRSQQKEYSQLSKIERICRLQHYGTPTRLLDVSSNALVSLWFACQDPIDSDGCVYTGFFPKYDYMIFNRRITNYAEIFASLLTNSTDDIDINSFFSNECYNNPNILLHDLWCQYIYIEIPPSILNKRMKAQEGAFIIPPLIDKYKLPAESYNNSDLAKCMNEQYFFSGSLEEHIVEKETGIFNLKNNSIDDLTKTLDDGLTPSRSTYAFTEERFIIKKKEKINYLKQLNDMYDINEKTLFPD